MARAGFKKASVAAQYNRLDERCRTVFQALLPSWGKEAMVMMNHVCDRVNVIVPWNLTT